MIALKRTHSRSAVLAVLVLAASLPFHASAQGPLCDFGTKITELKALQSSGTNEVVAELNVRKDLLKISIGCLKKETKYSDSELQKIESDREDIKAFAEWIHRQIQENVSYYNYKETQIDSLGLKGAKDFAKELANRKEQVNTVLDNLVVSLTDWMSNENLFKTGEKRFADIKKTLSAFNLPHDHEILLLEKEAMGIFNEGKVKHQETWKDLSNREVEASRAEAKESLELLAEAYEVFLKISEVSKKTLPL
ncbi:MAG: hypothetical protein AAB691_03195 [Patescibacteria group bacterium]